MRTKALPFCCASTAFLSKTVPFLVDCPARQPGKPETYCKLDIDIHNNKPNVLVHTRAPAKADWHGSEVSRAKHCLPSCFHWSCS
eukprot:SAG22_NODE_1818_length_3514_cov_10.657980_4_plen_85_part_00